MTNTLAAEVAELQTLLAQTKTSGNRRDLEQLLQRKQKTLEAAKSQQEQPMEVDPQPVKVAATRPAASDLTTFTEISRFGWEDDGYGKEKVAVYVMSGIDGVGNLPKENVTCHFTKTSFDLKIVGLDNKNFRLFKQHLEKEIDPAKSSFRVKKNRVTISLHKADKNDTWMNLTAKNPLKTSKPDTSDPAAGIMDMMKNMYEEGDDEMKRTIAKAWTESRQKTDAASPF
ncbi:Calcyclin-binding protein [Phytophthora nicotianae]|nr:Calcyclin-binding protein [Phytophthora nicotianae]KUF97519.1 COBW domain-containing protein 1 [Phytophthora nicotianae]